MLLIVFYLPRSILFIVASQAGFFNYRFPLSSDCNEMWEVSPPQTPPSFVLSSTCQQVLSNYMISYYPSFLSLFSSFPSPLALLLAVPWHKGPPVPTYWWFFFKDQKQKQNQNKTNSTPPEKSPFICELVSKRQSALRAFFFPLVIIFWRSNTCTWYKIQTHKRVEDEK